MSRLHPLTGRLGLCATGFASADPNWQRANFVHRRALAEPVAHGKAGFTLVEMLVAMAITLVMMAAVVTLFANVSNSVRNRRATTEMSGQLRHTRNVLQQDLRGATCPGQTWQRPESNHGYIEIIEGQHTDSNASPLVYFDTNSGVWDGDIDPAVSLIPRNNGAADTDGNLEISPAEIEAHFKSKDSLAFGGLGDFDDILMLTVRNETAPFVGRMPGNVRDANRLFAFSVDGSGPTDPWTYTSIESPLAEVVWFAIENPKADEDANGFFGEPGMRTIYRRTLLIAPWVNPYRFTDTNGVVTDTFTDGGTFKAQPGLVRLLPASVGLTDVAQALAALVAFQDRYDLSVRLEWDHNIGKAGGRDGRWKIMANTLGDLTKRENRFGHFGFHFQTGAGKSPERLFPYAAVSTGSGYSGTPRVQFVADPDVGGAADDAEATANLFDARAPLGEVVKSYSINADNLGDPSRRYLVRPFAFIGETNFTSATARAMLNDDGEVVRVVQGMVPLWGLRRGEDVMMTDALAFDLRVYDAGAPLFRHAASDTMIEPSDAGWITAYMHDDNMKADRTGTVGSANRNSNVIFPYVGQGAYVDLGYGYNPQIIPPVLPSPVYAADFASAGLPWFLTPKALTDVSGKQLAPGYAVYDTWSFHYENNGRDDDGFGGVDQGTNGLDDEGNYSDGPSRRLGVDDVGERETAPPYDKPLRGMQVLVRVYERDSRAIRQVRVNQHFMPE